jgi:hypothetical protein
LNYQHHKLHNRNWNSSLGRSHHKQVEVAVQDLVNHPATQIVLTGATYRRKVDEETEIAIKESPSPSPSPGADARRDGGLLGGGVRPAINEDGETVSGVVDNAGNHINDCWQGPGQVS